MRALGTVEGVVADRAAEDRTLPGAAPFRASGKLAPVRSTGKLRSDENLLLVWIGGEPVHVARNGDTARREACATSRAILSKSRRGVGTDRE